MTRSASAPTRLPEPDLKLRVAASAGPAPVRTSPAASQSQAIAIGDKRGIGKRLRPRTIDEDQYQSGERVLYWSWRKFASRRPRAEKRNEGDPPKVNSIGPIHGMFNSASDLAEVRRLIEGTGADDNMVLATRSLADGDRLGDADANVCMCIAYGPARCRPIGGSAWTQRDQGEGVRQTVEPRPICRPRLAFERFCRRRAGGSLPRG